MCTRMHALSLSSGRVCASAVASHSCRALLDVPLSRGRLFRHRRSLQTIFGGFLTLRQPVVAACDRSFFFSRRLALENCVINSTKRIRVDWDAKGSLLSFRVPEKISSPTISFRWINPPSGDDRANERPFCRWWAARDNLFPTRPINYPWIRALRARKWVILMALESIVDI